jgi:bacteriocin-like protein
MKELEKNELKQVEGGMFLHWGWYAGAFGAGLATGLTIRVLA